MKTCSLIEFFDEFQIKLFSDITENIDTSNIADSFFSDVNWYTNMDLLERLISAYLELILRIS